MKTRRLGRRCSARCSLTASAAHELARLGLLPQMKPFGMVGRSCAARCRSSSSASWMHLAAARVCGLAQLAALRKSVERLARSEALECAVLKVATRPSTSSAAPRRGVARALLQLAADVLHDHPHPRPTARRRRRRWRRAAEQAAADGQRRCCLALRELRAEPVGEARGRRLLLLGTTVGAIRAGSAPQTPPRLPPPCWFSPRPRYRRHTRAPPAVPYALRVLASAAADARDAAGAETDAAGVGARVGRARAAVRSPHARAPRRERHCFLQLAAGRLRVLLERDLPARLKAATAIAAVSHASSSPRACAAAAATPRVGGGGAPPAPVLAADRRWRASRVESAGAPMFMGTQWRLRSPP